MNSLSFGGQVLQMVKIESASTVYSDVEYERMERPPSIDRVDSMVDAKNDNIVWIKSEIPSNEYEYIKEEPLDGVVELTETKIQSNNDCVDEDPFDNAEDGNGFDEIECMKYEIQSDDFGLFRKRKPLPKMEFICDVCGKVCYRKDNLLTHIRTHRREKQFDCDECGLKFTLKQYLIKHQRVHDEQERRFRCDECGSAFVVKNRLKAHILIHSHIKPFACDKCDSKFSRRYALNLHKLTHESDVMKSAPHACDLCEKRFKRKQYLDRHQRIHSGDRPFGCHDCGKRFRQRPHLKEHQLTMHSSLEDREKKMIACHICDKKFLRPYNLKRHLEVVCNKVAK